MMRSTDTSLTRDLPLLNGISDLSLLKDGFDSAARASNTETPDAPQSAFDGQPNGLVNHGLNCDCLHLPTNLAHKNDEISQLKAENERLKSENSDLVLWEKRFRTGDDNWKWRAQEFEKDLNNQQRATTELQEKLVSETEENERLKSERSKLQSQKTRIWTQLDRWKGRALEAESDLGAWKRAATEFEEALNSEKKAHLVVHAAFLEAITKQNSLHEDLKASVTKLEASMETAKKELQQHKPLVEVGIAIRNRFLEHTKQTMGWGAVDPEMIVAGNAAAHQANLLADTSLYWLNYRDIDDIYGIVNIWKQQDSGLERVDNDNGVSTSYLQTLCSRITPQIVQFFNLTSTFWMCVLSQENLDLPDDLVSRFLISQGNCRIGFDNELEETRTPEMMAKTVEQNVNICAELNHMGYITERFSGILGRRRRS
ncbi:hypothetical protein GLAREA_11118 [Glarea lozoyensis ATCC 20868]|uniref:Uncharacterized protein n=1 Tax=Glarea lozoyensis (strain ATCC 20868 / MF5171) TaxID=1116229 RepID=S3DE88_GLAL2|nr:uncharacterized protein GLAREA_11118 [Glarea lozoyensis ATCC 20868]EPE35419.1 hypothetical protein GLAREA_11118 [Glarea lozoyensis ATCC 20868]